MNNLERDEFGDEECSWFEERSNNIFLFYTFLFPFAFFVEVKGVWCEDRFTPNTFYPHSVYWTWCNNAWKGGGILTITDSLNHCLRISKEYPGNVQEMPPPPPYFKKIVRSPWWKNIKHYIRKGVTYGVL